MYLELEYSETYFGEKKTTFSVSGFSEIYMESSRFKVEVYFDYFPNFLENATTNRND